MSLNLSLIEFQNSNDGRLYEENYQIIETADLGNDLREDFRQQGLLKEVDLYEDENSCDFTKIEVVDDNRVLQLLESLEQKFRRLFLVGRNSAESDIVVPKEVDAQMAEFRKITNLHYLVKLKAQQFDGLNNCILKLG
jgi:hypothetical protein